MIHVGIVEFNREYHMFTEHYKGWDLYVNPPTSRYPSWLAVKNGEPERKLACQSIAALKEMVDRE